MQGTLSIDYGKAATLKDVTPGDPVLALTHFEIRVTQANAAAVVHTLRIPKAEAQGKAEITRDLPAGELTVWLLETDATGLKVGPTSLSGKFTVAAVPPLPPTLLKWTTINPAGTLILGWVPA